MSGIFGGGEQSSESRPVDLTPQEYAGLREQIAGVLSNILEGGRGPGGLNIFGPTPGPNTAGIRPAERTLLNQLMLPAAHQGVLQQTLAGGFRRPNEPTYRGSTFETGTQNPLLQAYIESAQRPVLQGLEETLSRTLPGRFTQAGQFLQPGGSSAFDRAAAIASRGASQAQADIATNIGFQAFEGERERALRAHEGAAGREATAFQSQREREAAAYEAERQRQQQAIQLSQQDVAQTLQNLQAQALPRLIEQHGIDQGMEEYRNRVNTLLQFIQQLQSFTSPAPANVTTSTQQQAPNIVGTLLGGGGIGGLL